MRPWGEEGRERGAGRKPEIQLHYDPSQAMTLSIVQGLLAQSLMQEVSRSSFSGRAYRVACPGQPEVDAGTWFRARLASLRTGTAPR